MLSRPRVSGQLLLRTFLLCTGCAALLFTPFLIVDKGFFIYCGDYNTQSITFEYYMAKAVQNGLPAYSWCTDLGSGFVESYSFYLLGSPFFWLSTLLPAAWEPYAMVPMLCLKFGVAGLSAALWGRRYTKTELGAQLVGLLYALNDFTVYNFFFHFTDMIALFPFLLWSVDAFFEDDRRGLVPLTVAVCLFTNYFFFIAEVVFVLLYVALRLLGKDWRFDLKKLLLLGGEAALGVAVTAILTLPTFLSIVSNPRVDNYSDGLKLLFYTKTQQYLAIFTSAFLPQDPPYLPNLFTDCTIKWTSMTLYLPFFGMAGVLTWLKNNKKHTFRRVLLTCLVMALVPILNSAFYAFNSSYYCRWYHMPLLIMGLITVCALEESPREDWLPCIQTCGLITAGYLLFALLPTKDSEDEWQMGAESSALRYFLTLALTLLAVVVLYLLAKRARERRTLLRYATVFTATFSVVLAIFKVACGKLPVTDTDFSYKEECYDNRAQLIDWLNSDDTSYYRIDTYETFMNMGLWLDRSCLHFFSSTVDPSIMEFYPEVGLTRTVNSKPTLKQYGLFSLLNTKYLLVPLDEYDDFRSECLYEEDWLDVTNDSIPKTYRILENTRFIPFGSAYEYYITREQFELVPKDNRSLMLLHALLLDDRQIEEYGDILQPLSDDAARLTSYSTFLADCEQRRAVCCDRFLPDDDGFTAYAALDAERMLFFAVPWNAGWTATVNGEAAVIEKVDNGLMALRVPAGDSVIRFDYETVGLRTGKGVTLIALGCWVLYLSFLLLRRETKKRRGEDLYRPVLSDVPWDALPPWRPAEPPTDTEAELSENAQDAPLPDILPPSDAVQAQPALAEVPPDPVPFIDLPAAEDASAQTEQTLFDTQQTLFDQGKDTTEL